MSEPNQQEDGASSKLLADTPSDKSEDDYEERVLGHDKATGIVVFGAFVAGSLVGVIVCAPAFVVFLLGATTAALCFEGGQAGKVARKMGKGMSDVILLLERMVRQLNHKYKPAGKAKKAVEKAAKRVKKAAKKNDFAKKVKSKAKSARKAADKKKTGGKGQSSKDTVKSVRFEDGVDGGGEAEGKSAA